MALTPAEVESMIDRFLERVRQHMPVDEVWLYGSYVTGTASDESDIDIAVVSPVFADDYWEKAQALGRARDPDALLVEPIGFPTAVVKSPPPGSFIEEILRTGRRVA